MRRPATVPPIGRTLFALPLLLASSLAGLALAARPARADPILYEVCYDGDGADADDVFTEIYGSAGFSLDGWSIEGVNGLDGSVYRTVSLDDVSIPDDGLLVLATSFAAGDVLAARDGVAEVDWQNGPDAIRLVDPDGAIADALQYGDAGAYGAGEGAYAEDVPAGYSLTRDAYATDTDDNASDWTASGTPTPGTGPSVAPVPEPASLLLVGTAALGFGATRRRRRRRGKRGPQTG